GNSRYNLSKSRVTRVFGDLWRRVFVVIHIRTNYSITISFTGKPFMFIILLGNWRWKGYV
ncbi:MAG TPA: hypothetical protein VL989_03770, partial [Candidatus Sulfotelmatobacter sp.]|nr:hypothetical protein [Candidatus Sulfotelmatobacter sp.]